MAAGICFCGHILFVDTYPEGDIYVDVFWTKRLDDFENRRLAGQRAIEVLSDYQSFRVILWSWRRAIRLPRPLVLSLRKRIFHPWCLTYALHGLLQLRRTAGSCLGHGEHPTW